MPLYAIDHVQLAMPPQEEERARAFYGLVLGLSEQPKPQNLATRGGVWFECGSLRLRLGVEPLAGYNRVYVYDPFGNRIELLEPKPSRR